jgi:hypothetical protein
MNLSKIILIILLIIGISFLIWKINKDKNKEHLTNLNEAILNMISLHKDRNIILNSANIDIVRAEKIDVLKNLNVNKGIFNNINVNKIDISNNITATTGNIGNLTINKLTGTNGSFRNVRSNDISSNTIYSESGTFGNITTQKIYTPRYDISSLNINKICFDPNDSTKCLTIDTIKNINNIENLNINNQKNQYMYYPNDSSLKNNLTISNNNIIIQDNGHNVIFWNNLINEIKSNALKAVGPNETFIIQTATSSRVYSQSDTSGNIRTSTMKNIQPTGTGIEITVPQHPNKDNGVDYSVLWVKCMDTQTYYYTIKLYQSDANNNIIKTFGKHADGKNGLNKISPDGSIHNDTWNTTQWIPIPFDLSGNTSRKLIMSNYISNSSNVWNFISSMAFSTNPWNHCKVSSISLIWQSNKTNNTNGIPTSFTKNDVVWNNIANLTDRENWNNLPLAQFNVNSIIPFRIPFVNSGKDKIFYLVEHNNNWGPSIIGLTVLKNINNTNVNVPIGNFYTSFNNPFSRHYNSKMYQRYYGIVIPVDVLPVKGTIDDNFITLQINIPNNDTSRPVYFSEVGTHDKNSFE